MDISAALTVIILLASANGNTFFSTRGRFDKHMPSADRFNYFDMELLQKVIRLGGENSNVLVSPASLKILLAMVLEGAGGQSEKQIREALRLPEDKEILRARLGNFLRSIQASHSGNRVEVANRLFISKQAQPLESYKNTLAKYYGSDVRQVDFSNSIITATTINDWVATSTHNLIERLVDPVQLNSDTTMMLVNAVYFKGRWSIPFDLDSTSIRCFSASLGSCQKAYFMETLSHHRYAYIKGLDAEAIEIPYEGEKFSMLIILPKQVGGISQLVRDLTHTPIQEVLSTLEGTDVLLSIPRFTVDFNTDLVEVLKELDITDVFGPKANLSQMIANSASVHINKVLQKAKIIVNEEGSEAAVATGAIAIPLMGNTIPKFRADHPFIFFIREVATGSVLFEGEVVMPDAAIEAPIFQATSNRPSIPQQPNRPLQSNFPIQPNPTGPVNPGHDLYPKLDERHRQPSGSSHPTRNAQHGRPDGSFPDGSISFSNN